MSKNIFVWIQQYLQSSDYEFTASYYQHVRYAMIHKFENIFTRQFCKVSDISLLCEGFRLLHILYKPQPSSRPMSARLGVGSKLNLDPESRVWARSD